MSCPYVFKKGKSKNQVCGAKLKDGSIYCHKHDKQEADKLNNSNVPPTNVIPPPQTPQIPQQEVPPNPFLNWDQNPDIVSRYQQTELPPLAPQIQDQEREKRPITLNEVIDKDVEIIKLPHPDTENEIKMDIPQDDEEELSNISNNVEKIGFNPENMDKDEIEKERKIVEYYRTLDFLNTLLPIEERMGATADEWLQKIDEQRQKYFTEHLLIKRGMKSISQAIEYFSKNKLKMKTDGYSRIIENDKHLSDLVKVLSIKHCQNLTQTLSPELQFAFGLGLPLISLHFGSENPLAVSQESIPNQENIFLE